MPSPQAPQGDRKARLVEVCRELLQDRHLIVAGNRGPVEYVLSPSGEPVPQRGHGGLVTALGGVSQFCNVTWVASAMGEADRRAAHSAGDGLLHANLPGQNIGLRFVICPRNTYHKYYNVFSNPLLWFLQHYMWNSPYTPNIDASTQDAWDNGYVAVNQAFADGVVAEMRRPGTAPVAMIHDYQLYLVGRMVREAVPWALLSHFVHVPWPSSGSWRLLPSSLRRQILDGLLANDLVGFQTVQSARDFLYSVEAFLPEARLDLGGWKVSYREHSTRVGVYPTSVDVTALRRAASSPRVQEYQARIAAMRSEQTIVRVDRVDPSRNIVRGFRAFEIMLERHPELARRVTFLAFLTPSRTRVREYQRYGEEVTAVVNAINSRHGDDGWQPIKIFLENNYLQALAALRLYDVLLVNSVADGMNLVAKEGPMVNTRDGVLVLSEGTGAFDQLRSACLEVAPTDLEGTAQALYVALSMDASERQSRTARLRELLDQTDVTDWLYAQFMDLRTSLHERATMPVEAGFPRRTLPVE